MSCLAGQTNCSGTCRDLQNDLSNCGVCGRVCPAGQVCTAGSCVVSCLAGQTNCSGTCRDLATDNAHCGACGNACPSGQSCVGSSCVVVCGPGITNCGGVCRDLSSDRANCGACGRVCTSTQLCASGSCVAACPSGQTPCSGSCVNTTNNTSHCGSCGNVCPARANATTTCASSSCGFTCNAGFGDCDGNASNGCETNLNTSNSHCGVCGRACAGTCTSGTCVTCDVNLAPSATATNSSGGENSTGYGPNNLNNGVYQGPGSACGTWAWVSAGTTPGSAWFQYTWSSPQRLTGVRIDTSPSGFTCTSPTTSVGRNLAGTDIQYWNGSTWVTIVAIRGQTNDWSYTFPTQITTTALRLYAAHTNGAGQGSNPKVFEWEALGCR